MLEREGLGLEPVLVVSLPTLHLDWIEAEMPRFGAIARDWYRGSVAPVFPALTCPAHATLTTGAPPAGHGVVANGIFDRAARRPEFWVFGDEAVGGRRIWDDARAAGRKTGAFFLLNIFGAEVDAALLPKPVHHADGSMEPWCWHRPEGLYPRLAETMGHFDLSKFWGPMAGIESSRWIAEAARRTIVAQGLDLSFVYLPHTDYAPQKAGPRSDAARAAHRELDGALADLIEGVSEAKPGLRVVVMSEYAMTEVSRCVKPNLILREMGLLAIDRDEAGRELIDYGKSRAFAMADHQIAHVYGAPGDVARIRERFEAEPGIDEVATREACGLGCARSGELILIARRDAWFAYPWWSDPAAAPAFAATVDIHAKPGYDPLEMFWDREAGGIAQDTGLIRGSHGAPARDPDQRAAIVSNLPGIENVAEAAEICAVLKAALE